MQSLINLTLHSDNKWLVSSSDPLVHLFGADSTLQLNLADGNRHVDIALPRLQIGTLIALADGSIRVLLQQLQAYFTALIRLFKWHFRHCQEAL